jgi:hypothetical protein
MVETSAKFLFLVCEGRAGVAVMAVTDETVTEREAVQLFGLLAGHLRRIGAPGRLVLLDEGGRRLVARRIWP